MFKFSPLQGGQFPTTSCLKKNPSKSFLQRANPQLPELKTQAVKTWVKTLNQDCDTSSLMGSWNLGSTPFFPVLIPVGLQSKHSKRIFFGLFSCVFGSYLSLVSPQLVKHSTAKAVREALWLLPHEREQRTSSLLVFTEGSSKHSLQAATCFCPYLRVAGHEPTSS